jgi:hypothetical protein
MDPSSAPGCCYNYDPSLGLGQQYDDDYVDVQLTDGRVLQYYMNFPSGTAQSVATADVLAQFPSDARTLWSATKDTCVQMVVASATLGDALASDPQIGDPEGMAFVEFDSDNDTGGNYSYSASSVREAIFMLGDYPTPGSAPAC